MMNAIPPQAETTREKLTRLFDYVAQVVRLDERVAFDLATYKLADGRPASFTLAETGALPGVRHDLVDEGGPVWLAVERLKRTEAPAPPDDLAPWLTGGTDPARQPETLAERMVTVDEAERTKRIAAGACATSFTLLDEAPVEGEASLPPRFRQTISLGDLPGTQARLARWIGEVWAAWAAAEQARRRSIHLYERLYRLLQHVETGGAEAPIEIVWGIGMARWRHAGRVLERPLIERAVDIELDEAAGGLLRVRPTVGDAVVDLKPYEEMGCVGLDLAEAAIRRAIEAGAEDGVSPFRRASFEPVIDVAVARLDPDAAYVPRDTETRASGATHASLTIDDSWVLFARPRSAHVLLADIERLKAVAADPERRIDGLSVRLVTEPSALAGDAWQPLSDTLGDSAAPPPADEPQGIATEVFFPKPFNDDQVEIVRRLARSDGLVVQGPPGTGKTHTIANLICHAMATGQRVLVLSRGEAALAVLRDQLPEKVRPLTIALLSNERQGLAQVEGAIREIQSVVEASRPEIRHAAIRRCEAEIVKLRGRIAAIDAELDTLAAAQAERIGPRDETPADLAMRLAEGREAQAWFTDRPEAYLAETGLREEVVVALSAARRRIGDLIDHREAACPAPADLPEAATIAVWHDMIVRRAARQAVRRPDDLHLQPAEAVAATALAEALDGLARLQEGVPPGSWLHRLLGTGEKGRWGTLLDELAADWIVLDGDRAALVREAADLPPGLLDDPEARAAIARGAQGERLWPMLSLGRGRPKSLVAAVRLRGAPLREGDQAGWQAVAARLAAADRERDLGARWRALATEIGAPPASIELRGLGTVVEAVALRNAASQALARMPEARAQLPAFAEVAAEPARARDVATRLRQAIDDAGLEGAREATARIRLLFEGEDRTATMARRFLDDVLGRPEIEAARVAATWEGLRTLFERVHACAEDFDRLRAITALIAEAGAPNWADRLRREPATADVDPLIPRDWRETWDFAAADAHLGRLDARERLTSLARQRGEAERNVSRLFLDLVRERTFYALDRRLSPGVKSALVEFVRALSRLGKGTGRGAARQRRVARDAMQRCYAAVPCWIMPTWRVSEQLPAELSAFDLVILDEASQSDVTELPAILRGRKILVVGDDRQVSPMAPFVAQTKIDNLRQRYLRGLPFQSLLEPGESLYTLMQAVFPDERLMLKEHFRCVEPIIRFSMGFYPETLVPLRVPAAAERLDPPLIDIFVPHGAREKGRKINPAEAAVIVDEIAALAATPGLESRSIGVISLIGADQAEHIRGLLADRLGAELMQRHAILCGDSATFQGNERDIVFLSMVADRQRRTTLTMQRYEQRFNVAMSRGRDRVVLVRSVERRDLNPADLKARLIAHFEQPMPALAAIGGDALERCESDFEREMMRRLMARGYLVTPQVGALGFRIDLVVEGAGGRRLAVECDGDRFHGPGQWREDMRRQRVLERVGWRFWRCFASSFYADPDGVLADLVETLTRFDIAPFAHEASPTAGLWVEHRIAPTPAIVETTEAAQAELPLATAGPSPDAAALGDRLVLSFADDRKTVSVLLTDGPEDWGKGLVSATAPLGAALFGHEEEDEVELPFATGVRKALVERVERAIGAAAA